jgi:hypothetical protein
MLVSLPLKVPNCQFPTADFRLPTADCRLPIADCRFPTADCPYNHFDLYSLIALISSGSTLNTSPTMP